MRSICALLLAAACGAAMAQPASVARPGDRIQTDARDRLELRTGRHLVHVDGATQLQVEAVEAGETRLSVRSGSVIAQVPKLRPMENVELGTPNVAVRATAPGRYRIDADPERGVTQVTVLRGAVRVFGETGEARELRAGERATFAGRALVRAGDVRPAGPDAFERWSQGREHAQRAG